MMHTCIDTFLQELHLLGRDSRVPPSLKVQIHALQREFRFLKMIISCFLVWDDAGLDPMLGTVSIKVQASLEEAFQAGDFTIRRRKTVGNWDFMVSKWQESFENFKPEVKETCLPLFDRLIHGKIPRRDDYIFEMIDIIQHNLKDLIILKAYVSFTAKKLIQSLEKDLGFVANIFQLVGKRCNIPHDLEDFGCHLENLMNHLEACANGAACLLILYWIDGTEEKLSGMLFLLQGKIRPCTVEVTKIYLEAFSSLKPLKHEGILIQKVVSSFVDLFLENLVVDMNDLEMIREGLMLFTYLLVDKLEDNEDDRMKILAHHCFVIDDVMPLICSICDKELSDNIFKENTTAFLEQVSKYKAEVIKLCLHILPSSCCNFPRTNGLGFIDSLLKNLKVILECKAYLIPFEKHQIARIHEELNSIRPFLKQIFELQEKHEEFKNLWTQIVNVAYYAEQVCDSCLCFDATTWHNMICLWNVVEEIEMIKTEVKEIRGNQMHNSVVMNDQIKSINMFSVKTKTPTMYEIVVGYADEATTIVDRLTRGSKQLDIVSIVGLPGLGKTTLAREVYNDPSVRFHFNKLAWCCITQVYNRKELILDILRDVVSNENLHDINEHELAERLRRCLKGTRYLIVMDDIWDVSPWHQLKESFPDDNNGSRIMFTSRIHKVASEAKNGCIPHHLRTFSHEESMELLQKKLSIEEDFPPELSKLGKQIAKDCKGLPLAVVLIAGLLAKKGLHLEGWKEIAETLGRNISTEGCMSLLELSYKHLPEFLKPCFLYFGAFQEGQVVQAKKLIQLWIAEGFILKNDPMKSLEDVAHEYLADLICRSLVILGNRSSNGRIKDCRVHDLLHSFCLAKAKEERFLHFPSDCHFPLEIYRVRIHPKLLITSVESTYANQCVHSLLFKGKEEEHTFASSFLLRFKLLKVLDMENMKLQDSDFLEQITSLVHLRYLALSLVLIDDLPSSIENLWRLEVLVVKSPYHGIRIPHTFWKMKSLRHVYVNRGAFTYPYKSFQLNNLETLKWIDCLNYRTLLRKLPNVRKLGIILSSDYDDIPFSSIPSKLEALELHKIEYTDEEFEFLSTPEDIDIDLEFEVPLGDDNDDDDLDSSIYKVLSETDLGFEPSSTSKKLHKVQDSNLQFEFLSSLKKLSLLHIRLSKKLLSAIGKLPNLEVLKLLSAVFEGGRWDVKYDEFLRLQFLKLSSSNISNWDAVTDDTFPCLERLVMKYCHLLQEIPSCFGEISTFKRIEVHWCSKKVVTSAMQILKENRTWEMTVFKCIS